MLGAAGFGGRTLSSSLSSPFLSPPRANTWEHQLYVLGFSLGVGSPNKAPQNIFFFDLGLFLKGCVSWF